MIIYLCIICQSITSSKDLVVMRSIGALVFIFLLQQNVEAGSRIDPLVDTKVGLIRGLRASDGDYSMFLGIPFGKVDEQNPFGTALPYPEFDDVYEAYNEPSVCPQIDIFTNTPVGSLDCLRLNIYVPSTAHSKNRLPVLVWIHGGGFVMGDGNRGLYDPKFLIRHDVIFVSLHYRLGPYGFMCLDTPEIPGNQGLKDQVLALRWINKNIESFGGDVDRITIFGESAGAMSVDMHLFSEQEKLFNSVIMNSGSALIPEIGSDPDLESPLKLAQQLGLSTSDLSEALAFLRNTDTALVVAAAEHVDRMLPCVEKEFENVERFLADYPLNINPTKARRTSMLTGFNSHECFLCYGDKDAEYYNNFNQFYNNLQLGFNFDENRLDDMIELIKHFYIGDEAINENERLKLCEFESDIKFVYPAKRSLEKYVQNGAQKVFYYMFSYNGGRNFNLKLNNCSSAGAAHADDLGYLFNMPSMNYPEPEAEDQLMIDWMTTMWTNFVKYGDPTPETSELLPVKWEPITSPDSPHYFLNINADMQLGKRPYHARTAFWDLFYEYNKKFQKGYAEE